MNLGCKIRIFIQKYCSCSIHKVIRLTICSIDKIIHLDVEDSFKFLFMCSIMGTISVCEPQLMKQVERDVTYKAVIMDV